MSPWLFYYGIGIADPGPPARNLFAFGSERYAHRGGLLVPAILYRNPPILNPTETHDVPRLRERYGFIGRESSPASWMPFVDSRSGVTPAGVLHDMYRAIAPA